MSDFENREVPITRRMQMIRDEIGYLAAHVDAERASTALRIIAHDINEYLSNSEGLKDEGSRLGDDVKVQEGH